MVMFHLREQTVHLAARAMFRFASLLIVLVTEKVISEEGVGEERLQDDVHKARLPQVEQSTTSYHALSTPNYAASPRPQPVLTLTGNRDGPL